MKIAIIQFPGSNCHRETKLAVERAGMEAQNFLWNEDKQKLHEFDGYVIVGGFSYEDRGRAGLIAALDPILKTLTDESEKGKLILGICNGAQILVEAGLVPGLPGYTKAMALTTNKRMNGDKTLGTGFYNDWVYIKPNKVNAKNAFTSAFDKNQVIRIPVAHAEGRFLLDEKLYESLQNSNSAIFQYCDKDGNVIDSFPTNPNGSSHNLAAISNASGNVMAMMPHPERTMIGDPIFTSMREYIKQQSFTKIALDYETSTHTPSAHEFANNSLELIIALSIHDNAAISINNALQQAGFDVTIKRFTHWEIDSNTSDKKTLTDKLERSYELYNPQKECLVDKDSLAGKNKKLLLIHEKENLIGKDKQRTLSEHFNLTDIQNIKHSILWQIETPNDINAVTKKLTNLGVFANPVAHECYNYEAG